MILRLLFTVFVASYLLVILPFTGYLKDRPVVVKLGYLPHAQILKISSAEHQSTVAELSVLRVLFYYGSLLMKYQEDVIVQPEYLNMYKTLQAAVHLDPYNQDAYYFTQAAFTWDVGRINEVNHLLEKGVEHRTWDPWLPFYVGFNYAYFLQNYEKAAVYFKKAAEISDNPLFATLTARYLYESQKTGLGLTFLDNMIKRSKDKVVRKTYQLRRDALFAISVLEEAVKEYESRFKHLPQSIDDLIDAGVLEKIPLDPYGGRFYLEQNGKVRSTSKLALSN